MTAVRSYSSFEAATYTVLSFLGENRTTRRQFRVGDLLPIQRRRLRFFVVFVFCSVDFGGLVVAVAMSFVGVGIVELMIVPCCSFGTTMSIYPSMYLDVPDVQYLRLEDKRSKHSRTKCTYDKKTK